jgi:hypothetical protein
MFRSKTTITPPDRDRLVRATHSRTNLLRWGLFIDELQREIDRAHVIEPARVPNDGVTMHSTVRIRHASHGAPEIYTLVYPEEAAPRQAVGADTGWDGAARPPCGRRGARDDRGRRPPDPD